MSRGGFLEIERKVLRLLHGLTTRTHLTEIHAHFLRHNLHNSNQILSHFVLVCSSLHKMPYAARVFSLARNPNVLLFNAMIKGYSLHSPFQQSFNLFSLMRTRSIIPDEYTYAPLLKAASNLRQCNTGRCLHAQVVGLGFERHGSIRVGVVELYSNYGEMGDAQKVLDEMRERDVVVWNLIVRGFCEVGDLEKGLKLFRKMKERSVVSWNLMISSMAQGKKDEEALGLFCEMLDEGLDPDDATLVTVLPVCARIGALDVGEWMHSYADDKGLFEKAIAVGNSLVDFYCKCGNLQVAWRIFNGMPKKDVVSWNAMISGLAYNGEGEAGVDLFEKMVSEGVIPTDSTIVGVLPCCAHAGLVDQGRELFASMSARFQLSPQLEHYGCIVDLLGRFGLVREAHELIRSMPMKPTAALWGALLSACRTHGDKEVAEAALTELIRLEHWNSGNYVLLSNIYAEEGRWDEVEKVRLLMQGGGVKKVPGQSATG